MTHRCPRRRAADAGFLAGEMSGVPGRRAGLLLTLLAALLVSTRAEAWVLNITAGTRALYLQIGNGTANANNATINLVSVTVPAAQVGSGTAQAMTSNSTQSVSFFDNFVVCNPPAEVYVGGFWRAPAGTAGTAVLQVVSPATLTSGTDSIPFTTISWTSTANGTPTADIPAGTFNGGTLFLRNIALNTWVENCHIFSYSNTAVRAAGTYNGRVTYQLSAP